MQSNLSLQGTQRVANDEKCLQVVSDESDHKCFAGHKHNIAGNVVPRSFSNY